MTLNRIVLVLLVAFGIFSCTSADTSKLDLSENNSVKEDSLKVDAIEEVKQLNDAAAILAKKEIPILCYHHIRDYTPNDKATAKPYIVPISVFDSQMKALKDSGYQSILIEDLMNYLEYNTPLPEKSVMITFDDTNLNQYTEGLPILEKYGFKGVFFMMTVSIGKERYMSKAQIKSLSDKGHDVQLHTWDHKNVKKFEEKDWNIQITKAAQTLENITGKEVVHFAFPFGLWNPEALPQLKELGMKSAYQLADKRDTTYPLHTIRRIIVPGTLSGNGLIKQMNRSF